MNTAVVIEIAAVFFCQEEAKELFLPSPWNPF